VIDLFWPRAVWHGLRRRFRRSAITFAGIAFSVATLAVLYAIMTGVGDAMTRSAISLHTGHALVTVPGNDLRWASAFETQPNVKAVLPRHILSGVLHSPTSKRSLTVYGVDPGQEQKHTVLPRRVAAGDYLATPDDILLGHDVAEALTVTVGDRVTLWLADAPTRTWRVGGVLRPTTPWLDSGAAFVRSDDLGHAVSSSASTEAAVFLSDAASLKESITGLRAVAPADARIASWHDLMPEVVQLVSLNHISMGIVIGLVLLILAFGISNTVVISVTDRTVEFAILKTLGVTPRGLSLLVVGETLTLVLTGAAAGLALGATAVGILASTGIDLSAWTSANQHFVASGIITPRATAEAFLLPVGVTLLCGVLASFAPARRAGSLRVVQALRPL
jgi:ABC-type lipoprotein release transport system permease subunit